MVGKASDHHRKSDEALSGAPPDDGSGSARKDSTSDGDLHGKLRAAWKGENLSVAEQVERLAALNLSSASASRPRFSLTVIRVLSAMAGVAALLVLYFCFKLFV